MLIPDTEEVIARFIGMFGTLDFDPRLHPKVAGAELQAHDVEPAASDAMVWGGMTAPYDPRAQQPQLRFANDAFELEKVHSRPPATHDLKVENAGLLHLKHAGPAHPAVDEPLPAFEPAGHHLPVVPTTVYHDVPTDALLARYAQTNDLDDRDTFSMDGTVAPPAVADNATEDFIRLVETAEALRSAPTVPQGGAAGIETKLAVVPLAGPADGMPGVSGPAIATGSGEGWTAASFAQTATHAPGQPILTPFELEGAFVDGALGGGALPAIGDILRPFREEAPATSERTLDTGSNALTNEASLRNIGELGFVTAVMGDWHETNSIRQFNIHGDVDSLEGMPGGGLLAGGTRATNMAEFGRIDASPIAPAALPNLGFLPSHYEVDVVEGNLQITSFLSQLNFTLDGDRVALTSTEHSLSVSTGGNDAKAAADLLKSLGSYDLVIIGGGVYEGNFIEQFNVLADNDRLLSQMTDPSAAGISGSTGGNLLLNAARIVNVGGVSDMVPLTPEMSKLVSTIAAHGAIGDPQFGADLGFLGSSTIRVLYLTGNVYEMNVVSQMNILDDSDAVLRAGSVGRAFVDAAGPHADWQISTGRNALVNAATITDVDDVAFKRFMDGQYYSSSMLVQADIVDHGRDVVAFDPHRLVPEIVAFMHDDLPGAATHDSAHPHLHHDAPTEGLGSMLS